MFRRKCRSFRERTHYLSSSIDEQQNNSDPSLRSLFLKLTLTHPNAHDSTKCRKGSDLPRIRKHMLRRALKRATCRVIHKNPTTICHMIRSFSLSFSLYAKRQRVNHQNRAEKHMTSVANSPRLPNPSSSHFAQATTHRGDENTTPHTLPRARN